jgi:uncharacterized protein (UPF0212 family)
VTIAHLLLAATPDSLQISLAQADRIIQAQQHLATFGVTILLGVAGFLLVATWIWNFVEHRRAMNEAVSRAKADIERATTEFVKAEVTRVLGEYRKEIDSSMHMFEGDKCRLFALLCGQREMWNSAARWIATSIPQYAAVGQDALVRMCVDLLEIDLNRSDHMPTDDKAMIEECLRSVPLLLRPEKERIAKKLGQLRPEPPPAPAAPLQPPPSR